MGTIQPKYIELEPGTSKPKVSFDEFVYDISKISDAAYLVPEDVVVVDFDHVGEVWNEILNLYPTRAIKTNRGAHLYYKIPPNLKLHNSINIMTYCGLNVDYKTGYGKKKASAKVKVNGVLRTVLNDIPFDNLAILPMALYPVAGVKYNLYNLDDGDGRNQAIYKHIKILQDYGVPEKNIIELADFINNKVFKTPLTDTELKPTVISAFKKSDEEEIELYYEDKNGNKKLDIFAVAEYVNKLFQLKIYNGRFYFLKEDKNGKKNYVGNESTNNILREILEQIKLKLKKAQDNELLHQLTKIAEIEPNSNNYPIKFNNGFILDGEDVLHMDTVFTPFNLDVAYDPEANSDDVDNYIKWFCNNDKSLIMLFEEILGHILMTSSFPHHVFFFVANSGKNGKSTTLTMISNFVGDLHSSVALEEFDKSENLFAINGKLVNCGDDIDASLIEKSRAVKTLAAGNEILCRALYENPIKMKSVATLLFTCNEMPNFKDKSGGIARRVICFPCNAVVEKIDMKIDQKLSTPEAKSRLLNIAIKGMKRIINNGGELTKSELVKELTDKYLTESDNVKLFIEEYGEDFIVNDILNDTFAKIYVCYTRFCDESGYGALSKKRFSHKLEALGFETYKTNGKLKIRKK
ncbi:phage/plasmid primase, P4 family [Fusobacterium animalis]|uniref:DNA primase family protein n=1 Tax=Fusobacterium animalis TaxID=76859 RepID=UPI0030CC0540